MRALLTAILVIAVAATVFVAGWTQFQLPPSTCAVLFTKTRGYHPEVIKAGDFSWSWERVIPTNATLFLFDLQPQVFTVRSSGHLPSGADLAAVLPIPADFSFDVTVVATLAVRPEALPSLMETRGLTPEGFPEWTARQADTIAEAARELLQHQPADALVDLSALESEITDALRVRFPMVELVALQFAEVRLPDLELYERARAIYFGLLDAEDQARRAAIAAIAPQRQAALVQHQAQQDVLDALNAYGELLERRPVLLEFLSLPAASSIIGMHAAAGREVDSAPTTDTSP